MSIRSKKRRELIRKGRPEDAAKIPKGTRAERERAAKENAIQNEEVKTK